MIKSLNGDNIPIGTFPSRVGIEIRMGKQGGSLPHRSTLDKSPALFQLPYLKCIISCSPFPSGRARLRSGSVRRILLHLFFGSISLGFTRSSPNSLPPSQAAWFNRTIITPQRVRNSTITRQKSSGTLPSFHPRLAVIYSEISTHSSIVSSPTNAMPVTFGRTEIAGFICQAQLNLYKNLRPLIVKCFRPALL